MFILLTGPRHVGKTTACWKALPADKSSGGKRCGVRPARMALSATFVAACQGRTRDAARPVSGRSCREPAVGKWSWASPLAEYTARKIPDRVAMRRRIKFKVPGAGMRLWLTTEEHVKQAHQSQQ